MTTKSLIVEVHHPKVQQPSGAFEPDILIFIAKNNEDFEILDTTIRFTEEETNKHLIFPIQSFICAYDKPAKEETTK